MDIGHPLTQITGLIRATLFVTVIWRQIWKIVAKNFNAGASSSPTLRLTFMLSGFEINMFYYFFSYTTFNDPSFIDVSRAEIEIDFFFTVCLGLAPKDMPVNCLMKADKITVLQLNI